MMASMDSVRFYWKVTDHFQQEPGEWRMEFTEWTVRRPWPSARRHLMLRVDLEAGLNHSTGRFGMGARVGVKGGTTAAFSRAASIPLSFEPTAPDYIVWAREGLVAGLTKIQQESLAGNNPCPVKFSKKGKGGWSRPRRDRLRFTDSDGKWGIEFVIEKWHSGSRPGFGLTVIVDCMDLGCCTGTLDNCGD